MRCTGSKTSANASYKPVLIPGFPLVTHPLPCISPDLDSKAFDVPRERCRASYFFAVATAFVVRRNHCRGTIRCRALRCLCHALTRCRAGYAAMLRAFAVRSAAPFAMRRAPTHMAKPLAGTPARPQDAQVCAMWRLFRVYAYGNVTKWSFASQ
jgi:hypothetical protein